MSSQSKSILMSARLASKESLFIRRRARTNISLLCCGCGCCGDCDACTVVCVACVFSARMLGCEGDANSGVGPGGMCGCGECIYGWYT